MSAAAAAAEDVRRAAHACQATAALRRRPPRSSVPAVAPGEEPSAASDPIVFRVGLDGRGGVAPVDEAPGRWTHYRMAGEGVDELMERRRIEEHVAEAMLEGDARPRATPSDDGLLVVLRGVNLNPGADPEDMVSMRAWLDAERIVTVSRRRVLAIEDVRATLDTGDGPRRPSDVLAAIAERLVERMRPVVDGIEETVDELHERMLREGTDGLQRPLADLRHEIATLRRHMAPQREALEQLARLRTPWLDEDFAEQLQEAANRQVRYVEDLGAVRERASVLQDELNNAIATRMSHNTYLLSVVAAVFLPLGLLTGLLGINVGGMPGSESPAAFWVVCALLGVLAAAQVWFFRRQRML